MEKFENTYCPCLGRANTLHHGSDLNLREFNPVHCTNLSWCQVFVGKQEQLRLKQREREE